MYQVGLPLSLHGTNFSPRNEAFIVIRIGFLPAFFSMFSESRAGLIVNPARHLVENVPSAF
jgi:glycerol uptake facilitator-like aquaporin